MAILQIPFSFSTDYLYYLQRIPPWGVPVSSVVANCKSIHAAVPDADNTINSSLKEWTSFD